jgi:hypothetical protein
VGVGVGRDERNRLAALRDRRGDVHPLPDGGYRPAAHRGTVDPDHIRPEECTVSPSEPAVRGRSYQPTWFARAWSHWPRWTAWGALCWSAGYAAAGALWWSGVDWYPFAKVSLDRASLSLLETAPADVVGPVFVAVGLLGVGAAAVFLSPRASGGVRRAATAFGAVLAVTATCLIPDYTMLALLALWPVLVVFSVTGIEGSQDGIGDILYWHRVNLILVFAGGLLWTGATLAARRRVRGDCVHCGRAPGEPGGLSPRRRDQLLAMGRRFVWMAVLATLPYDLTRFAWFLGWPLGLSEELFESLQDPPELLTVGLVLGLLSTGGAALTHGLVSGWGERFPGWLPRVAGRRVPILLAVVPASLVTVTLPPASIMFASPGINGDFDLTDWGAWLPSMFWILWAVGLGGATWAYHQRRRGACRHCPAMVAATVPSSG